MNTKNDMTSNVRKKYIAPETEAIGISHETAMLAGSGLSAGNQDHEHGGDWEWGEDGSSTPAKSNNLWESEGVRSWED